MVFIHGPTAIAYDCSYPQGFTQCRYCSGLRSKLLSVANIETRNLVKDLGWVACVSKPQTQSEFSEKVTYPSLFVKKKSEIYIKYETKSIYFNLMNIITQYTICSFQPFSVPPQISVPWRWILHLATAKAWRPSQCQIPTSPHPRRSKKHSIVNLFIFCDT